jgi:hypothetical protein
LPDGVGKALAKYVAVVSGLVTLGGVAGLLLRKWISQFFPVLRLGLITPPTNVYVDEKPPTERIDQNYLKSKTKWMFAVVLTQKMEFDGFLWDSDYIRTKIESRKPTYGEKFEARKSLSISVTPKDLKLYIPLTARSAKVVLLSNKGKWENDQGDESSVVDVETKPLSIDYYVSGSPTQFRDTFTLTVNGKSGDFTPFVAKSQEFEGVTFEKQGHLVGDEDIPDYTDLMLIPIPKDKETIPGEITDSNGNRWLVLKYASVIESLYINPDSANSYNYEIWGNEKGGEVLELWRQGLHPGEYPQSQLLPDWDLGFGWGIFFKNYEIMIPYQKGVKVCVYPRQADLWRSVSGLSANTSHTIDLRRVEEGGDCKLVYANWVNWNEYRQNWRIEKNIPAFMIWLASVAKNSVTNMTHTTTFGTYGDKWYIDTVDGQPYLVINCPLTVLAPLLTFSFPGDLADVVVYSPLAGSFQLVSASKDKSDLYGGQTATLTVTVKNTCDFEASATVEALGTNEVVSPVTRTVTLKPGEVGTATFSVFWGGDAEATGKVKVTVYNSAGTVQGSTEVSDSLHPAIGGLSFHGYTIVPPVAYGTKSTLTVTVRNKDAMTYSVRLEASAESPLSVSPATLTKDVATGDTGFAFDVTIADNSTATRSITVKMYKGTEYIDTMVISVTPNSAGMAEVYGTVRDVLGKPIEGATVSVVGTEAKVTTDKDGRYSMGLQVGTYRIRAEKAGYLPSEREVSIGGGRVQIDFTLLGLAVDWLMVVTVASGVTFVVSSGAYVVAEAREKEVVARVKRIVPRVEKRVEKLVGKRGEVAPQGEGG